MAVNISDDSLWTEELTMEFLQHSLEAPGLWSEHGMEHEEEWRFLAALMSVELPIETIKKQQRALIAQYERIKEKLNGLEDIFQPKWFAFDYIAKIFAKVREESERPKSPTPVLELVTNYELDEVTSYFDIDEAASSSASTPNPYNYHFIELEKVTENNDTEYVESTRGSRLLHYDGHLFYSLKDRHGAHMWRCSKYRINKCPGIVYVVEEKIVRKTQHSHGVKNAEVEAKMAMVNVRKMAKTTNLCSRQIYKRICSEISIAAQALLPKMKSFDRAVCRARGPRELKNTPVPKSIIINPEQTDLSHLATETINGTNVFDLLSEGTLEYVESKRGCKLLAFDNYLYSKISTYGQKILWGCVKRNLMKCPGRLHTLGDNIVKITEHSHDSDPAKVEARIAMEKAKAMARDTNKSAQSIYSTIWEEVAKPVATALPVKKSFKRALQRAREKKRKEAASIKEEPNVFQEFGFYLEDGEN